MRIRACACAAFALLAPLQGHAQEAYLTQISAGPISVNMPARVRAPRASVILANLQVPSMPVNRYTPDLSAYPVIDAARTGPVSYTTTIGDNNSATTLQDGIQAASITQYGNANTAMIAQSGFGNRASIYQVRNGGTASVIQRGRNNTALTIQR